MCMCLFFFFTTGFYPLFCSSLTCTFFCFLVLYIYIYIYIYILLLLCVYKRQVPSLSFFFFNHSGIFYFMCTACHESTVFSFIYLFLPAFTLNVSKSCCVVLSRSSLYLCFVFLEKKKEEEEKSKNKRTLLFFLQKKRGGKRQTTCEDLPTQVEKRPPFFSLSFFFFFVCVSVATIKRR